MSGDIELQANPGINTQMEHAIWSRNIAMKIYKQRFVDTLGEYRRWKESHVVRNAQVTDWATMLRGLELKDKAQMWLTIYLRLKAAQTQAMRD